MSPADRRLLKDLAGRPMFRCTGGWRRGSTKISSKRASELIAAGAFRRTASKRGEPMLVPTAPGSSKGQHQEQPQRVWWMD